MVKKILKATIKTLLWIILGILGLLLIVSILIYIPPIQNAVAGKAAAVLTGQTGFDFSIGRFRLRFPLRVSVEDILIRDSTGQRIIQAEKISADVAFFPLFAGKIKISEAGINKASVNYKDAEGSFEIEGGLDLLRIGGVRLNLKKNKVSIRTVRLSGVDMDMLLAASENDTPKDSAPAWEIGLQRLSLDDIKLSLHSAAPDTFGINLGSGDVRGIAVNLPHREIAVESVELNMGVYSLLTAVSRDEKPITGAPDKSAGDENAGTENPWKINVNNINIADNAFIYDVSGTPRTGGLDTNHLRIEGIYVDIGSVYNYGTELSAQIKSLALKETVSGLAIKDLSGDIALDSDSISVAGLTLITPYSLVTADIRAGASLMRNDSRAGINAAVNATVGWEDIVAALSLTPEQIQGIEGRNFVADAGISGSFGNLNIERFAAAVDNNIFVSASGRLANISSPGNISGEVNLRGRLSGVSFLKSFIQDASLRSRIGFPNSIEIVGNVAVAGPAYSTRLTVTADEGSVEVRGNINTEHQTYDAYMVTKKFPLYKFLPADSLGYISMTVDARGQGFDPVLKGASAEADLVVSEFGYRGYVYDTVSVVASLKEGRMAAMVKSRSEAAKFTIDIDGAICSDYVSARIVSCVKNLDLYALKLQPQPARFSLDHLCITAGTSLKSKNRYRADMVMSGLAFDLGELADSIKNATLKAEVRDSAIDVRMTTEDLLLTLHADGALDSLSYGIAKAADIVSRQIDSLYFDMAPIGKLLPRFSMELSAGSENIVRRIASRSGISFGSLSLNAVSPTRDSINIRGRIQSFGSSGLTLDTLLVGVRGAGHKVEAFVRMANRPGNIDELGLLYLFAKIEGNYARIDFMQRDRDRNTNFRIGVDGEIYGDRIVMEVNPADPIIAGEQWSVNSGNYFIYGFDKKMSADLRLDGPSKHLYFTSVERDNADTGQINADIAGVRIGQILRALPNMPPLDGMLSTNLNLGFAYDLIVANGTLSIDSMSYAGKSPGDIEMRFKYLLDSVQTHRAGVSLNVNEKEAIDIGAKISMGENGRRTHVVVQVPDFPLDLVNIFLPTDTVQIKGALHGKLDAVAEGGRTLLNGALSFSDTEVSSPLIGTSFSMAEDTIRLAANNVLFDSYRIISSNGQPLNLTGSIDINDLSQPVADMRITARNFQAVNASRTRSSTIYGQANLNIDITAQGALDALVIRGGARVLRGTDIGFTPQRTNSIRNTEQNIVRFVSFADQEALAKADSLPRLQTRGMDILLNLDIDNDVRATVNLSPIGSDRLELQGGGALTYTVNTQGDERFSGRYNISGGRVLYNPPLIPQKDFSIIDGSYVEWTGEMMNPSFHITATETIRATVRSDEDSSGRFVDFVVTLRLANTLDNMDLTFDLSAPGDIAIQSQLASLDAEQRFSQALSLLIYNTYIGPGTSASINAGLNNTIYSFVENELNNWARNNISGVDVSFGINSYENGATNEQRTDYSYKVSKRLFGDRVTISIGGSISSDQDADANARNNLVEDIIIEYRITKRDNMFIKVFRININDMLEGEITKTGFGFVVRRKMDRLNELFRITTDKKIRRRIEARRRQQEAELKETEANGQTENAAPQGQAGIAMGNAPETGGTTDSNGMETERTHSNDEE